MPGPLTTNDLLSEARAQMDESNTADVSDADILAALNRAQRKAANIVAKRWEDALLEFTTVSLTAGTDTYDIPEDAYGRRIDALTCVRNGLEYPLKRVSYRDLYKYTSTTQVAVPYVYAMKGRSYIVKPLPASGVTLKLWYTKAPETLVLSQGRITSVSVASSYVLVDSLGSGLTTSTDALGAFVNIVDAQSGKIKVTLQVSALTTASKQVTFKTSGLTYATVYNRTVATAVPTTVEVNDLVCAVQGTCVPDLPDACLDFYTQYAVHDVRRRMGEPVADEAAMLKALENDVERQWAGRESVGRIANKARPWTR